LEAVKEHGGDEEREGCALEAVMSTPGLLTAEQRIEARRRNRLEPGKSALFGGSKDRMRARFQNASQEGSSKSYLPAVKKMPIAVSPESRERRPMSLLEELSQGEARRENERRNMVEEADGEEGLEACSQTRPGSKERVEVKSQDLDIQDENQDSGSKVEVMRGDELFKGEIIQDSRMKAEDVDEDGVSRSSSSLSLTASTSDAVEDASDVEEESTGKDLRVTGEEMREIMRSLGVKLTDDEISKILEFGMSKEQSLA